MNIEQRGSRPLVSLLKLLRIPSLIFRWTVPAAPPNAFQHLICKMKKKNSQGAVSVPGSGAGVHLHREKGKDSNGDSSSTSDERGETGG